MRPIEYIIHLVWDHSARVIMMSVVTTASSFALGGTKIERLCISWESHCWQWALLIWWRFYMILMSSLSFLPGCRSFAVLLFAKQLKKSWQCKGSKVLANLTMQACIILCYDSCMVWSVKHCFRVHGSAIVHVHNIWFTADSCTAVWSCKKSVCDNMLWILWQQRNLRRLCTQLTCSTLRG